MHSRRRNDSSSRQKRRQWQSLQQQSWHKKLSISIPSSALGAVIEEENTILDPESDDGGGGGGGGGESPAPVAATRLLSSTPIHRRASEHFDFNLQEHTNDLYFSPDQLTDPDTPHAGVVCPKIERRLVVGQTAPRSHHRQRPPTSPPAAAAANGGSTSPTTPRLRNIKQQQQQRERGAATATATATATVVYPYSAYMIPYRWNKCVEPITVRLFRDRNFSGPSVTLRQENRLTMWAEQFKSNKYSIVAATDMPKLLYFRSIKINMPVLIFLFALFCEQNRIYIIPLVIRNSNVDIDLFIRRHIHYSSVYNPYGSGSYAHWIHHHIQFFIGWTVPHHLTILHSSDDG